ncbi:hypothetical protein BU14_0033s0028 [Porphyra umbilicalis]|uniref:WDR36/Utp21 N-terminal domain-containing protein n=1 Tax=Porphyra umbilicalis TaxID=2786 RepID=A0A1X6PIP0_PORUM|nr:hypothetical protein BU14_0033s0028 [Porphyra umbilicalis]|eukprot:OSX80685.1 hypothetical protein BU14_0033s0028 [Porphyra umbilicalis]
MTGAGDRRRRDKQRPRPEDVVQQLPPDGQQQQQPFGGARADNGDGGRDNGGPTGASRRPAPPPTVLGCRRGASPTYLGHAFRRFDKYVSGGDGIGRADCGTWIKGPAVGAPPSVGVAPAKALGARPPLPPCLLPCAPTRPAAAPVLPLLPSPNTGGTRATDSASSSFSSQRPAHGAPAPLPSPPLPRPGPPPPPPPGARPWASPASTRRTAPSASSPTVASLPSISRALLPLSPPPSTAGAPSTCTTWSGWPSRAPPPTSPPSGGRRPRPRRPHHPLRGATVATRPTRRRPRGRAARRRRGPPPPPPPPPVRATLLAAAGDLTYVATGARIGLLRRLRPAGLWARHTAPVTALLPLGGALLASAAAAEGRLLLWASPAGTVVSDVRLPAGWAPTALAHPPTYLNKLLVGGGDGRLGLVNVRTGRLVHAFTCLAPVAGVAGARITALAPAAVLDVVAVGTSTGVVALVNVRTDAVITVFRHGCRFPAAAGSGGDGGGGVGTATASADGGGGGGGDGGGPPITALSFRTDGMDTLLSASADGSLAVWHLPTHSLAAVLRGVHPGGVAVAVALPGEATAVTVGAADNAVKVHVADDAPPPPSAVVPAAAAAAAVGSAAATAAAAAVPRLLRSRAGAAAPPVWVRFLGEEDGRTLLVGGGTAPSASCRSCATRPTG